MIYPIYIIVLSSGAATLALEILLARSAANVLGAAYPAQLMTISLYLAGFSLGSLLALKKAHWGRWGPAILIPICLVLGLYKTDGPVLIFLVICSALFCGLTTVAFARTPVLYFASSIGGAAGAALTELTLNFGLKFSYLAVGVALLPALFLAIKSKAAALYFKEQKNTEPGRTVLAGSLSKIELGILFAASALILFLECDLLRLAALFFGSSRITFSLVLAVMLLGLSLGNWLALKLKESSGALLLFGIALAATTVIASKMPEIFLFARRICHDDYWTARLIGSTVLVFPAALGGGLVFPTMAAGLSPAHFRRAYFISALGAAIAPLFFHLTILFGPADILQLILRLGVCLISIAASLKGSIKTKVVAAVTAFSACLIPPLSLAKLSAGLAFAPPEPYWLNENSRPLFFKTGPVCTTTVELLKSNLAILKNDGKVEATIPLDLSKPCPGTDWSTQNLLALLPQTFFEADCRAEGNSKALIIGLGSGTTTSALLEEWPGKVITAELEPAVQKALTYFPGDKSIKLAEKEGRCLIKIADGRSLLADGPYDLIISQPAEPRVSASSALYSREFFDGARNALTQKGIMAQWLQLYGFSKEELLIALKTFKTSFPYCSVFHQPQAGELILLGSKAPLATEINSIFFQERRRRRLANLGVTNLDSLKTGLFDSRYIDNLLKPFADGAKLPLPANTDDLPILERGPLLFGQKSDQESLAVNSGLFSSEQATTGDMESLCRRIAADPFDFEALRKRSLLYLKDDKIAAGLADIEKSLEIYPFSEKSHELHAIGLLFSGRLKLALTEAQVAHEIDLKNYRPYAIAALAYLELGDCSSAREMRNKAFQICPESAILKTIDEAIAARPEPFSRKQRHSKIPSGDLLNNLDSFQD